MIALRPQYEFFRPLVNGWIGKIEKAIAARKPWAELADECHDEKTEVLTKVGWKLFKDVSDHDLLATVNLQTDCVEYQVPTRLVSRKSNGTMIRFNSKTLDAVVTPNHRMVFFPAHSSEPGVKDAEIILKSDRLKLTASNWVGTNPELPDFLGDCDIHAFAEWLGFYIAEGWRKQPTKDNKSYCIGIAQSKPSGCEYYESLVRRLPFGSDNHQRNSRAYVFSHKDLWHYLDQYGSTCYDKVVPQWVKDAPQSVIYAFLRGYIEGDGCVQKKGAIVTSTASKHLADDIQELWIKSGRSASIKERNPAPYCFVEEGKERRGMSGTLYLVTAWKKHKKASVKSRTCEPLFSEVCYDGMVYCATVPNGTLITRRNGKPLISGNCNMFYSKSAAAMWDPAYSRKFWKGIKAPKFRITINKAFELVAVFGPNLYWEIPHRTVEPKRPLDIPQELFQMDPQAMQIHQMLQQQQQHGQAVDKVVSQLMQHWLNYTPREQPGGGLAQDGELATIDALVKGRGCLAGGTRVYARVDGRCSAVRVRDLYSIQSDVELWDGENWNRVVNVKTTPRNGDELKLQLRSGEEVNCTADHIWPTRRGNVHADDLVVGDILDYVRLAEPDGCAAPEHVPDELGWLIGLYVGDGYRPKDKQSVFYVYCHVDDTKIHNRLTAIVESYGGQIRWSGRDGGKNWNARITSPAILAILNEYVADGSAFKKHFRSRCLERSDQFIANIIEGYGDSDGSWDDTRSKYRIRFCDNKSLADDLRMFAARLNLDVTLRQRIEKGVNGKPMKVYTGRIRFEKVKVGKNLELGEITSISKADWRCDMYYDIAVENSPHTYALASGLLTHNCLWVRPYQFPSSGRTLTGCFREDPKNLLIDPDFNSIDEAKWIALRHVDPYWAVERRFKLPKESLKQRATLESAWSYGESMTNEDYSAHRVAGQTNDLVVWYEIWSKTGPGARLTGMDTVVKEHLEDTVGDYAYIAVCANVPYPLNMSNENLHKARDEEVKQAFSWPVPVWADDRWPVECLDFYPDTTSAWPIPPLAPAMGELKLLNFLVPWLCQRVWSSARDFWAVAGPHVEKYRKYLEEGLDQTIMDVPTSVDDVKKAITILTQPETRHDVWKIIDMVSEMFEKRTGLTDFAYGKNEGGTQNRTAEETLAKARAVGVRPEHMQKKVVRFHGRLAGLEGFVTRWFVKGEDVEPLLGPVGRYLWERYIMSTDVELVVRQMQYTIAAASIRRPNRDRDIANFQQVLTLFAPIAAQHGQSTGDYTAYNFLKNKWAEYHDADLTGADIQPVQQDQEAMQLQQQQMQMEMQKLQAELQGKQMELQGKQIDAQAKQQQAQMKIEGQGQQISLDAAKATQELKQDQAEHVMEMVQDRQKHLQEMLQERQMGTLKLQLAKQQAAAKPKPSSNGNGSR